MVFYCVEISHIKLFQTVCIYGHSGSGVNCMIYIGSGVFKRVRRNIKGSGV